MTEFETPLLRLIPLLPLLGAAICMFAASTDRRPLAKIVGPGSVLVAFLLVLFAIARFWQLEEGHSLVDLVSTWIDVSPLRVDLAFRLDALTSVMLLVVAGVGFLIHLYSLGYMHDDPDLPRFFAYLNLFTAAMLVLVLADSLPVLFIGWEGVGLCSYLLIGFWYSDPANADAGRKAFVANRVGDAAFLTGLFLLFWSLAAAGSPTLAFTDVNRLAPELALRSPGIVTAICLLLLVGATGKSAQIPLYVWLPDAMAGPTPVSALIHAATMVTAGVYMMARLSPLFVESPTAMQVVATIGAVTAVFAASIALVQRDLKKILAYSTISQIGYMVLGVGVGAFAAGVFHLMTHAFFKALLFLGAGSVMHALHGELDVFKMGGLKRHLPITSKTFLVGTLAIAGVPPLAAFFSKDMVLEAAFMHGHPVLWLLGVIAAGLTAFYMFRAYFLAFEGESRMGHEVEAHVHESPSTMTIPLVILSVLSIVGGWVGLPHGFLWGDRFGRYLEPVLAQAAHGAHAEGHAVEAGGATPLLLMLVTTAVAFGAIFAAWKMYARPSTVPDEMQARFPRIYDLLWGKYWVDEIYDTFILQPYAAASRFFWKVIDASVIDGTVNGVASFFGGAASAGRRLQTGNVQHYAFAMLLGAVFTAGVYWLWR
jgi:NADH-quinone oxidoreductase subunit L